MVKSTNILLTSSFALLCITGYSQARKAAGTYSYWPDKKGPSMELILYDVNDSTLFFYIEDCVGPPSYNSGALDGIIKIYGDSGIYVSDDATCVLYFRFRKKSVAVHSKENNDGCGYGNGVSPDGIYPLTNGKRPIYFINEHGDTTYFCKYNPKTYLK